MMPRAKNSQVAIVPETDSDEDDLDDIKYVAPKREKKRKDVKDVGRNKDPKVKQAIKGRLYMVFNGFVE